MSLISNNISEYIKNTKNICLCTTVSIILIFIFILSPLNRFVISSIIVKLFIILFLAYILYKNIYFTFDFTKSNNISLYSSWNNIKTNIVCSYIFSLFIFLLLLTVIRTFF